MSNRIAKLNKSKKSVKPKKSVKSKKSTNSNKPVDSKKTVKSNRAVKSNEAVSADESMNLNESVPATKHAKSNRVVPANQQARANRAVKADKPVKSNKPIVNKIMESIGKMTKIKAVRYLFFGGCTTLVNIVCYYLFSRKLNMDYNAANIISILLAIIFAYTVNKIFVFKSKTKDMTALVKEALHFFTMRIFTMWVEIFGVIYLIGVFRLHDMISKIFIQVVILVLNFLISQFVVFTKKTNKQSEVQQRIIKRKRICYILAFSIPMILTMIAFAVNRIYPVGDKGIMLIDSAHQYLPFFTEFQRKLSGNTSLLYSFGNGLGTNFWALYAYYLSGPLNFLIVLFPERLVMEGMTFLIILKIGISGLSFSHFLMEKNKKYNFSVVAFSVMFALSNFLIGYYFNIMWLDSVMLLPLIMLGVERLVKGKGGRYYGAFLFLAIYSNYYIGFMICIFSCIYYVVQIISLKKPDFKKIISSAGTFAWYSLLGGGMSAILLIPAYKALELTQSVATNKGFPKELKFYTSGLTSLTQLFAFVEPINISNDDRGKLNVYCGVLILLLLGLYVLDNKIQLRERVAKIFLCIFLYVSFSVNILNYVWHGFHEQNGLPNRFAFIFVAFALSLGFEALQHIRQLDLKRILVSCFTPAIAVILAMAFNYGDHPIPVYMMTFLLLTIYTWLIMFYRLGMMKKSMFIGALAGVVIAEIGSNTIAGFVSNGTITRSIYLRDQNAYQTMIARQADTSFYRSEIDGGKNGTLIRNGNMYVGGRGIVIFSSTVAEGTINLVGSLGMEARANKSGYAGVSNLVNDIFGIKYLMARIDAEELYGFTKIDEEGTLYLYENQDVLSIGFMVEDSIVDWDLKTGASIDRLNDFIVKAAGEAAVYKEVASYPMTESETLTFNLAPNEGMYLELNRAVEEVKITTPTYTKSYGTFTDHLLDLGCYPDGAEVTVEFTAKENQHSETKLTSYSYQKDEYEKVITKLAEHQLQITEYADDSLKGTIVVDEAKTLLLSIPYEEGWEIKVDGRKVDYFMIGDALIGINLDSGEHTLELNYTPAGFGVGTILSLICILLFILSLNRDKKQTGYDEIELDEREKELLEQREKGLHEFSRTELIIGSDGVEALASAKVAVFGVGGVGSYAVEALARAGIGEFVLVDNDKIALTNINRQLVASHKTLGQSKVEVARERIREVNPTAKVTCYEMFYTEENADKIPVKNYDYIIDAIDTVSSKITLIENAKKEHTPIISCMGTGNKLDPTLFEVADISETSVCPLAKVLRSELRKRGIENLKIVYSKELPNKGEQEEQEEQQEEQVVETKGTTGRQALGSMSFVPPVAGMILAGEVIKELAKKSRK